MIEIKLTENQSGYDVIDKYIRKYCDNNRWESVIVSMELSHDGVNYDNKNVVVHVDIMTDVDMLDHDYGWWTGQQFIKLLGINAVSQIQVSGGIYTE